jgi:hypothetical protein
MDESVEVPVLELDREGIRQTLDCLGALPDDSKAMFHIAHVVVGHLEDEQRTGKMTLHGGAF